jgi:hypothetical protein
MGLPDMKPDDDSMLAVFEPDRWQLSVDPGQIARVVSQVRARRRKRMAIRVGSGAIAAVVVAALALVVLDAGVGLDRRSDRGFFIPPRPTGPFPQLQVRHAASFDELRRLLRGTTVTELTLQTPYVDALTPSGELIAQTNPNELVLIEPRSGRETALAKLTPSDDTTVALVQADDNVIVWTEQLNTERDGSFYQEGFVTRCLDRATGQVRQLALPRTDRNGVPFPDDGSDLAMTFSLDAGRIALSLGRSDYAPNFTISDGSAVYLATRCGEPFEQVLDRASSARLSGRSLYYLHDDVIWRRDLDSGQTVLLATPAQSLFSLEDALVWHPRVGATDWSRELQAARLDGSEPSTVSLPANWTIETSYTGRDWMVAWVGSATDPAGTGLYFPSRGAGVQLDAAGVSPAAAAGRYLLLTEWSGHAPTGKAWLIQLP